jgi:hypothetical protein
MWASAAAGVAPLFVPASALGYDRPAPSDRIHVGFIGVGWKGLEGCWGSLVQGFTANPLCRLLAVCDINSQKCQKAKQTIDESYGNTDWDLWLGPAPWRPYHSALVDKNFRPFQEYSGGGMTDWGCHQFDDNFLESVRDRRRPNADVEIGCRTVSVCHLANIAAWLGRPIRWDPEREAILDDEEASRWLDRAKREPWNLG